MTDDFGNEVHACCFTGLPVSITNGIIIGSIIPGVRAPRLMANTPEAKAAKRFHDRAFHKSEANCNMCRHLERVKHEKNRAGFLFGRCKSPAKTAGQYPEAAGVMQFHPDDPGLMPCWEARP